VLLVDMEMGGKSSVRMQILKNLEKKIICVIFSFKNPEGHSQHKCLTENIEEKIEQERNQL